MIHQQPPNPQPFINEISFFIKIYKAEALLRCFILQFMTQRKMCYKKICKENLSCAYEYKSDKNARITRRKTVKNVAKTKLCLKHFKG